MSHFTYLKINIVLNEIFKTYLYEPEETINLTSRKTFQTFEL